MYTSSNTTFINYINPIIPVTFFNTDLSRFSDTNLSRLSTACLKQNTKKKEKELSDEKYEKELQRVLLGIKNKYGKNAILRGTSYEKGATARDRNGQIGGHRG